MFYLRLTGLVLLISGFWLGIAFLRTDQEPSTEQQLEQLPDFYYLQRARILFAQKHYAEAHVWCDDVISAGLRDSGAAIELRRLCEKQKSSCFFRVLNAAGAFLSGNPGDTLEEAGAVVLSDMLMYGDIRDLAVQGFHLTTDREHDWFIIALSSAGLAVEMVDAADWLPAVLKVLRKTAAVSDSLAAGIIRQLAHSAGKLRFTPEAKNTLEHLAGVFRKSGFIRTRNMLKHIHHTEDLKILAEFVGKNPEVTHLLAASAGKQTPELLRKLARDHVSSSFIKKLISKGPHGITLVLRGSKSVYKGNTDLFLQAFAGKMLENYGRKAYLLPVLLIAAGCLLNVDLLIRSGRKVLKKYRNKKTNHVTVT